jgi:SAM-dependent methyltransferase
MGTRDDILDYNRRAWDRQVDRGNRWTVPVSPEEVARARRGNWSIVLTPTRPVPADWFPPLEGREVLCLAGGGGQQGPILAAAGANVTVLDNSPRQLGQDRLVAAREGLELAMAEGDMADLGAFPDGRFDLVIHPCSNCFVPDVRPVWREAYRVLRPGGVLLAGFINPLYFLFDEAAMQRGELRVAHRIPYSDLVHLDPEGRQRLIDQDEPFAFGHSLDDLIGGQISAGFLLAGLFEDVAPDSPLADRIPAFLATRALKPGA